jgi:eukaryotic-like serine/threonine-protein kinase
VDDSPLTELRAALADRYGFERELGRGGMATVFLARDLRHDRPVAIKVLHQGLASSLGPERFQREIRTAARLHHPHILSVHDSGELPAEGGRGAVLWFAMPYVDGESLRARLKREIQLPVEDAVRIACEAADALDYAHHRGVIHRDVKPENILLAAGHALVADFGIALAGGGTGALASGRAGERAEGRAGAAGGSGDQGAERLTDSGLTVGTPAYMSPEQAAGETELDGRSDQYSLASVLWETLAGEPPFSGPTASILMSRRFTDTPRPLRQVRETVPEGVERAVAKALSKSPADRFASAADFGRALRDGLARGAGQAATADGWRGMARLVLAVGAAVALALALLLGWLRLRPNGAAAAEARADGPRRLAVLPFENLGPPEDDFFADGITDEIRGKLSGLSELQVTASSSSSQYRGTTKSPGEIGRELGVQYLLTGTVRWERSAGGGSRVRVSPELIQVATASTRWQQPFDAALTDVFQVQADVASRVAQALDVALKANEQQALAVRPTANLAAYELYLQGNEAGGGFDQVLPADLRRAAGFYERAVALDSGFALAWAQLSRAHSYIYQISLPTAAGAAQAKAAAQRALALAPDLAGAHLAKGDYELFVGGDLAAALAQYQRGRALAPNDADMLKGIGLVARSQNNWELSQASLTQAQVLDPRSIAVVRRLTYTLLRLRRYPEALASAEREIALDRRAPDAWETKAMAYLGEGDLASARRVIAEAEREVEPTTLVQWVAAYYDLYWVLSDEQQQLLLRLPPGPFDDDRLTWGLALAGTYALRGDAAHTRAYGDSARSAGEAYLRDSPGNAQLHVLQGLALAYAGRKTEALREGQRAMELAPMSRDAYRSPYIRHQLARIYLLVGEPDEALNQLEPLLELPYFLSPGWLRIDPTFEALRGNPRFRKLAEPAAARVESP